MTMNTRELLWVGRKFKAADLVHVCTISRIDPVLVEFANGSYLFEWERNEFLEKIRSGYFVWLDGEATVAKGEPVCTQCGTRNEYQSGPFVCGSCRAWKRMNVGGEL